MVKLVYCIRKRADMDDSEFARYWREVHGPIGTRIPGLRRLVQSHAVVVSGDARRADFDGVAELWFDDIESFLAARRSPEWRASTDDERNFIDPAGGAYVVTEEHEIALPGR
jgi:uncharacterized protein (TIGR02118 family)